MSDETQLGGGRRFLMTELKSLWEASGLSKSDAVKRANKGLRTGDALKPQTVSDWFSGTPAARFGQLWALVEAFLAAAENRPGRADLDRQLKALQAGIKTSGAAGPTPSQQAEIRNLQRAGVEWRVSEARWKALWDVARSDPTPGPDPRLDPYLKAASRAADHHPHPGLWGDSPLPPLAKVYVRRLAEIQFPRTPAQTGRTSPAENVFAGEDRIRVLLAAAGVGKSTLLRRYLADAADHWLNSKKSSRAHGAVPVLIRATDLAAAPVLAQALAAAATRELGPLGLGQALAEDFFGHHPRPQVPWLVMVDGLDEVADHATRVALLDRLAREADTQPSRYRFVVATRPLPDGELDRLGPATARFALQPFTFAELRAYAAGCFGDLPDTDHHLGKFMAGLKRSRLEPLARTPLMASMLCRLYAADPSRPLPEGRTGAYQTFVELLYEQNSHKSIRSTHDEAIRLLQDRHQIPEDNQAAEQAAQRVRNHLPELIDHLAHARISGNTAPTVEILAPHLHAQRPYKVKELLWNAFLGDLLRPTGLMGQHVGDFAFLHQTLLEYHAARHATRNEQARSQVLHDLFPPRASAAGCWKAPDLDPSHLGFLLDGLLTPRDEVAAATTRVLEQLLAPGGHAAYQFLRTQINLSTNLPPHVTAHQLTRLIHTGVLDGYDGVEAAAALARVDGYREQGIALLVSFTADTSLESHHRVHAADELATLKDERAAERLASLADDPDLYDESRVQIAQILVRLEGHRQEGAERLASLAGDPDPDGESRVLAAEALAGLEDHRQEGIELLTDLAHNAGLDAKHRRWAAEALAGLEGHRQAGARLLTDLAHDTGLNAIDRIHAARDLAGVDGHRQEGAELLTAFARNTATDGYTRMRAAETLAAVDEYSHEGVELLAALTTDTALDRSVRVWAAEALAEADRHRQEATGMLIGVARDITLDDFDRVHAARILAQVDGYRHEGVELLTALADGSAGIHAAEALANVEGHSHQAAELLAALARDTTVDGETRVRAAASLAEVDGYRQKGIGMLVAFADDPDQDGKVCFEAADALTVLSWG